MKLSKLVLLAAALVCFSAAALADAEFTNANGSITSKAGSTGYSLSLTGSSLVNVSGSPGYDCTGLGSGGCNGTVGYTTGLTSGLNASLIDNVTGGPTTLAPGGVFTIRGDNGSGPGGLVFKGTFTNALWTYVGTCTGTTSCGVRGGYWEWQLSGNVTGTFYLPGGGKKTDVGATVTLTTQQFHNDPFIHGTGTIGVSGGSSALGSPAPESGTLILFGTGLIGIALLARKKYSSRAQA